MSHQQKPKKIESQQVDPDTNKTGVVRFGSGYTKVSLDEQNKQNKMRQQRVN